MLMTWPSGSACATYFAATMPPAPSLFSTITVAPSRAESFSASIRAIVSDAAPGETPETRWIVFDGNVCAPTGA